MNQRIANTPNPIASKSPPISKISSIDRPQYEKEFMPVRRPAKVPIILEISAIQSQNAT